MPRTSRAALIYKPAQSPISAHNQKVADQNGWSYDEDLATWRDSEGFVIDFNGNTPTPVESCK